jgi:aspartate aminotransferase
MFEEGLRLKRELGEDKVYDFTLGNPDLEPPPGFLERIRALVDDPRPHMHQYMPNAGFPHVRAAVARSVTADSGVEVPASHVIMTVGAGGALNVVLKTILDPGDEVIVFSPYFVEYLFYVDNHGGKPVVVATDDAFELDLDALARAINPRTKAVIINSPNNPTGVVYSHSSLLALADRLRQRGSEIGRPIYLISDEPYRKILFEGATCPHPFALYEHTLLVYSHSKDLGLAGERIGHIAVHPDADDAQGLIAGMTFSIRILGFVNAPALMQLAVADCLHLAIDPSVYERRMIRLYTHLVGLGFDVVKPRGAFYMFPRSPTADEGDFVAACLRQNILVVPGSGFGRPGYFRISLTIPDKTLEDSLPAWTEVAKILARA